MVEDYKIESRIGTVEPTGNYKINKNGARKPETEFVERYITPAGTFRPKEWKKKAMDAIETAGEMMLLEQIKEYCKAHCPWLHASAEIEEHAIECLCGRSYKYWKDFEEDTIIWM